MSRETDVRVDYKLVDITAAADGALSMPNIQPFSDFTELLDEEQAIRRWATVETNAWELDGTMEILPDERGRRRIYRAARADCDLFQSAHIRRRYPCV